MYSEEYENAGEVYKAKTFETTKIADIVEKENIAPSQILAPTFSKEDARKG